MICNSGTAFAARVDGRRLSFEEVGIHNGVFVMRDRQTGSLWSHYTGEAFEGPLKGQQLRWIQLERAEAKRLVRQHPKATVPERKSMRFRNTPPLSGRDKALRNQLPPNFAETLPAIDGMPFHTHGLGVAIGDKHTFFPIDRLYDASVIEDRVGEVDVVVMVQDGTSTAAAWSRCVDGKTLDFESVQHAGFAALRDVQTSSTWDASGLAVKGPHKGARLTSVRSIITDWYGWAAYFQDSEVYTAEVVTDGLGSETNP